jgi:hypothetical protein
MRTELPKKQQYMRRKSALWAERSTWINRYQQITDFMLPYAGRYFAQDRNKGDRTFNKILDSEATRALRILTSGMMAGMTSPARPWFRLAIADKQLMEYQPVKMWLHAVSELMREIFNKSNTYNALSSVYKELGAFATAASIIEPDFSTVIHHTTLTAGEYAIATDERGFVNTLCREFDMTVEQIVGKFVYNGNRYNKPNWDVVSHTIKDLWDNNKDDGWVTVNHIIQPREDRDTRSYDAKNMAFSSCYFEAGSNGGYNSLDDKLLRESGYKRFPVLAPRWDVSGGDIYGNGPSFDAMGDIKQLQHEQLRKGQAIDFQTKPMLQAPASMRNKSSNILPGGIMYVPPGGQGGEQIRTAFEVNLDLGALREDIMDVRQRINSCFYADLFLMISQDNRATPATATEIAERHEEKLLMLGPVLERLHNELLSPKIDMTFQMMADAGILPPPPPELEGADLNVEFVSTLAQAQKMVGIGSLDRYLVTVGNLAAGSGDASVWDKVNKDEAVDRYADMLGIDPSVTVGDDQVQEIRQQRAQVQAMQQRAAAIPAAAAAAKDLAQADTSGQNALTDVMSQFSGYNATV